VTLDLDTLRSAYNAHKMTLGSGTRLGPYEILSPVARAEWERYIGRETRDSTETVAVKILPAHLSDNADLRLRFEREARAVSSLNHAHICTLHDIGRQDGVDYLVMEYLEGKRSPTVCAGGRSLPGSSRGPPSRSRRPGPRPQTGGDPPRP